MDEKGSTPDDEFKINNDLLLMSIRFWIFPEEKYGKLTDEELMSKYMELVALACERMKREGDERLEWVENTLEPIKQMIEESEK